MADAENKDPSMDEILQSIKRIISEETDGKDEPPAAEEDVLELTELVKDDGSVESVKGAAEGDVLESIDKQMEAENQVPQELVIPEKVELEAVEMPIAEPEPVVEVAPEPTQEMALQSQQVVEASADENLVSDEAAKASAAKLAQLREMVAESDSKVHSLASPGFRSGTTVEDLVIESLKPMLKEWLDLNLPEMVEKIVEREVRRISGR